MLNTRTFVITVTSDKPIKELADKIGGRVWSIDGIAATVAEPVRVTEVPSECHGTSICLPDHLAREAQAFGESMSEDSIEHGEAA